MKRHKSTLIYSVNFDDYILEIYTDVIGLRKSSDGSLICGRFLNDENKIGWSINDLRHFNPVLKNKCDEMVAKIFKLKAFL